MNDQRTGKWSVYVQDEQVWFEIADAFSAQHFRVDYRPLTEDDFVINGSPEWVKRQLEHALSKLTTLPQREWVGLTDEEIAEISVDCALVTPSDIYFARAIEAKLKEKNT